jgi:hypothetical protein
MSIIYPLIHESGPEFEISDADFAELQLAGEITLPPELRRRLSDLAHLWVMHLRGLQSPRPKQFRTRLKLIENSLEKAYGALDLNGEDASTWERHLFNWARNTNVEGATTFFEDTHELLVRMRRMTEVIARLERILPGDEGRRRPYDDEPLFITLANIFELAGGTAAAYWTEYPSGMADTPFRRFGQLFYKMLPIEPKRTPAGVDEALRDAIRSRRSGPGQG